MDYIVVGLISIIIAIFISLWAAVLVTNNSGEDSSGIDNETALNLSFWFALPLLVVGIVLCGGGTIVSDADSTRDKLIDMLRNRNGSFLISTIATRIDRGHDRTIDMILDAIKAGDIKGTIDYSYADGAIYKPVEESWHSPEPGDNIDYHEVIPYFDLGDERFSLGEPEVEVKNEPDVDQLVEILGVSYGVSEPDMSRSIEDILVDVEDAYRAEEVERLLTDLPDRNARDSGKSNKKHRMLLKPRTPWGIGLSGSVADVKSRPVDKNPGSGVSKDTNPRSERSSFGRKKRKKRSSGPALQIQICPVCGNPLVFNESRGKHFCKWCTHSGEQRSSSKTGRQ